MIREITLLKRRVKRQAKLARTPAGCECLRCGHVSRGHGQFWRHYRDEHLDLDELRRDD